MEDRNSVASSPRNLNPESLHQEARDLEPAQVKKSRPSADRLFDLCMAASSLVEDRYDSQPGCAGFDKVPKVVPPDTPERIVLLGRETLATRSAVDEMQSDDERLESRVGRDWLVKIRKEMDFAFQAAGDERALRRLANLEERFGVRPKREVLLAALTAYAQLAEEFGELLCAYSIRYEPGWAAEAKDLVQQYADSDAALMQGRERANRMAALCWLELVKIRNTARYLWRRDKPEVWRGFRQLLGRRSTQRQPEPPAPVAERVTEAPEAEPVMAEPANA